MKKRYIVSAWSSAESSVSHCCFLLTTLEFAATKSKSKGEIIRRQIYLTCQLAVLLPFKTGKR